MIRHIVKLWKTKRKYPDARKVQIYIIQIPRKVAEYINLQKYDYYVLTAYEDGTIVLKPLQFPEEEQNK